MTVMSLSTLRVKESDSRGILRPIERSTCLLARFDLVKDAAEDNTYKRDLKENGARRRQLYLDDMHYSGRRFSTPA